MKYKNPIANNMGVSCLKITKKDIVNRINSAKEAKDMIEDLFENEYLPYTSHTEVRGFIRILIEDLESQLRDYKKSKKEGK
jgi:hypothetical protein